MTPEPIAPPEKDRYFPFSRRAQSVYDLEVTLVKFLAKLFDSYRLDNPTVNLLQPDIVTFDQPNAARP
jgi:hypothetical protein